MTRVVSLIVPDGIVLAPVGSSTTEAGPKEHMS